MVPLGEVGRWFGGGTPSKSNPRYWTDGTIPWVSPKDMKQPLIDDAQDYITEAAVEESSTNMVEVGSVLVVARSGILQHTLPVAITTRRVALNQDIKAIEPRKDVAPRFLAVALKAFEQEILHTCTKTGTTVQSLELPLLQRFCIPIPPLADQRRIVAEIEKQFTRLDAGVAALRRVQANLKRYRAAVLKAACEGRLVPTEWELCQRGSQSAAGSSPVRFTQGPNRGSIPRATFRVQGVGSSNLTSPTNFETGEQLLQRILAERRRLWASRSKYREPVPPDLSAATTSRTPAGWVLASVDQLSSHITSGSRDWSQYYGRGTGTFVLAQNVRPMRLDMSERQAVDAPRGDAETERTLVRQNDILVTIVGAKTGDICRVPTQLDEHYVCQSVALIRPIVPAIARIVELWLASQENGQAIWKKFIYGQGRPHLSFDQIKSTPVLLPPLAEQERIVAEVERRLSVIDELEALVTANLTRGSSLRRSILSEAFSPTL